jgi:diadenylate cyclase
VKTDGLQHFLSAHWRDGLEIGLLWLGLHLAWCRLRDTRGARIVLGVALGAVSVMVLSEVFRLPVLDWLLRNMAALGLFSLVVIFQPELRRAAANLGNNRLFSNSGHAGGVVELLTELTFDLANRQLGALIALERDVPLTSWMENGVEIDGRLSSELVVSIFHPRTPLHDGGLILRDDRVLAAACIFPVTDRTDIDRNLGMRHRAALGLTEETDAVVIVVSEETGSVSLCHQGGLERGFEPGRFGARLGELLSAGPHEKNA